MSKDRIKGRDIVGDRWLAWKGDELDEDVREAGGVATVCVYEGSAARTAELDQTSAARLGAFLLEAAGVDLVSAARRVVKAEELRGKAESETAWIEARDAEILAVTDLAAELAKLDALT